MDSEPRPPAGTTDDAEIFSQQFAAETEEMNRCLDLVTELVERSGSEPTPPENFRPAKFRPR